MNCGCCHKDEQIKYLQARIASKDQALQDYYAHNNDLLNEILALREQTKDTVDSYTRQQANKWNLLEQLLGLHK